MSMSDEIIKLIDALAERFGIAIDWGSENVLPYLEDLAGRYIQYEIVVSVVWMVLAAIILVSGLTYLKNHKEFGVDVYFSGSKDYFGRNFAYGLITLVPTILILVSIFKIMPCIFLPEKVILEELLSLRNMM